MNFINMSNSVYTLNYKGRYGELSCSLQAIILRSYPASDKSYPAPFENSTNTTSVYEVQNCSDCRYQPASCPLTKEPPSLHNNQLGYNPKIESCNTREQKQNHAIPENRWGNGTREITITSKSLGFILGYVPLTVPVVLPSLLLSHQFS